MPTETPPRCEDLGGRSYFNGSGFFSGNMDDLRDKILWGYYDNTATNVPVVGYGTFVSLGRIQIARTGNGSTYYRSKYDTETLGPWRKIYDSNILTDSSELSSLASALGVRKWTRNTLNPNESLVISHTSDYAPIFIRELAKEGAGALILPEYNSGSYAILKTPKFDQVLSLEKTAQYTIIVTNISNITISLDYLALV